MRAAAPIVFVHGLFGPFSAPEAFQVLAPAPCSAPDLDGYGASAHRTGISLAGQVDPLRAHIASHHRGQRVHLVGHSVGAVYAFALADAEPDLVASVTSVEGNFTLADAFWSRSIAALDEEHAATATATVERAGHMVMLERPGAVGHALARLLGLPQPRCLGAEEAIPKTGDSLPSPEGGQ